MSTHTDRAKRVADWTLFLDSKGVYGDDLTHTLQILEDQGVPICLLDQLDQSDLESVKVRPHVIEKWFTTNKLSDMLYCNPKLKNCLEVLDGQFFARGIPDDCCLGVIQRSWPQGDSAYLSLTAIPITDLAYYSEICEFMDLAVKHRGLTNVSSARLADNFYPPHTVIFNEQLNKIPALPHVKDAIIAYSKTKLESDLDAIKQACLDSFGAYCGYHVQPLIKSASKIT